MNKLLMSSNTTKSPINSRRHANITNRHHYEQQQQQQLDNIFVNAASHKSSKNRLVTSTTTTTRTTHSSSTCSTEEDAEISSHNKNTNLFKKILEFEKISQQQSQPGFLLLSCASPILSSSFNYSSSGSSSSFNSRSSPIPAADAKAVGFMYNNFKTCGNNSLVVNTGASCVYKTLRSRQVHNKKKQLP